MFLEDFGIDSLRSALYTQAAQKIVKFEKEIEKIDGGLKLANTSILNFTQISYAIFAILFAILGLSAIGVKDFPKDSAIIESGTIAISSFALLSSVFNFGGRRGWWKLALVLSVALCFGSYWVAYHMRDLSVSHDDIVKLENDTQADFSEINRRIDFLEKKKSLPSQK